MIKEKRKLLGYTQEQMCNMLDISLRQYVRIDQEVCFPRSDILAKLISILDLSDEELGNYVREITDKKCS